MQRANSSWASCSSAGSSSLSSGRIPSRCSSHFSRVLGPRGRRSGARTAAAIRVGLGVGEVDALLPHAAGEVERSLLGLLLGRGRGGRGRRAVRAARAPLGLGDAGVVGAAAGGEQDQHDGEEAGECREGAGALQSHGISPPLGTSRGSAGYPPPAGAWPAERGRWPRVTVHGALTAACGGHPEAHLGSGALGVHGLLEVGGVGEAAVSPTAVTTSPSEPLGRRAAGDGPVTRAPPREGASSVDTPSQACSTSPPSERVATTSFAVFTGTAKATPTLPSTPEAAIWADPISSPAAFSSAPPELPWLTAASVWMAPVIEKPLGASDRAGEAGDDPGARAALVAEGVADGEHRVADRDLRRVAERDRLELGAGDVDLQQREVRRGIGAEHRRRGGPPGGELHGHGGGAADHVLVREEWPSSSMTTPVPPAVKRPEVVMETTPPRRRVHAAPVDGRAVGGARRLGDGGVLRTPVVAAAPEGSVATSTAATAPRPDGRGGQGDGGGAGEASGERPAEAVGGHGGPRRAEGWARRGPGVWWAPARAAIGPAPP